MTSALVDIDESRFPVVIMTLRGALGAADYDDMFVRLERLMARRVPYVMITDLREVTEVADAKRRQQIASWTSRMEAEYGAYGKGSVMLLESALVRGSLTALQWLTGKEKKDIWVGTMKEALEAAARIVESEGLAGPERRRAAKAAG